MDPASQKLKAGISQNGSTQPEVKSFASEEDQSGQGQKSARDRATEAKRHM
jgi:hypothetical protein